MTPVIIARQHIYYTGSAFCKSGELGAQLLDFLPDRYRRYDRLRNAVGKLIRLDLDSVDIYAFRRYSACLDPLPDLFHLCDFCKRFLIPIKISHEILLVSQSSSSLSLPLSTTDGLLYDYE